jgi:hypothetical protein
MQFDTSDIVKIKDQKRDFYLVSGAVLMEYEDSLFDAQCFFCHKGAMEPTQALRYKGICITANAAPLPPYPWPNYERMVKADEKFSRINVLISVRVAILLRGHVHDS